MTYIFCAENKWRLTSASYMPQSIWAFDNPLGVSIKKILQTAGYQFTVYRSEKNTNSSNKLVLLIWCSLNHIQKCIFRHELCVFTCNFGR